MVIALSAHDALIIPDLGVSVYLPGDGWYSLVISYGNHEEVLFQEILALGDSYVYRPDPSVASARLRALSIEYGRH